MLFTKPITHEESVPLHSSNTQQQYETPFSTHQKLAQSPVFQDGCHRAFPLHSMLYHLFCPNGTPHQRSHQEHPVGRLFRACQDIPVRWAHHSWSRGSEAGQKLFQEKEERVHLRRKTRVHLRRTTRVHFFNNRAAATAQRSTL